MKSGMIVGALLWYGLSMAQPAPAFLEKAIRANGPWSKVRTFYYLQEYKGFNPWQSYSWQHTIPVYDQAAFYMNVEKGQYHYHTISKYPGGYLFDLVAVGKDSTSFFYDRNYSRFGKILFKEGKERYIANMNEGLQALPYFMLRSLAGSSDSLQFFTSQKEVTIQRRLKNGIQQEFIFDAATSLLKRIESAVGDKKDRRIFEKYRIRHGVQVPTVIHQYSNERLISTETLVAFTINTMIPPDMLRIPMQYRLREEKPPLPLTAKEIAPDVFLIGKVGGNRNIVFVNMQDYIVVTEAPLSAGMTKSVIECIHTTLPGKPIRYVHLSHHHNDHVAGIRQLVAEGATIICAAPVEIPVRALVKGALNPGADDYSKAPKEPVFESFTKMKVLEDASHRIEFHEVPNTHAEGISFLYLPKEKIIYEGDLLAVPEDGTITPAIPVYKEFHRYLVQKKIAWKRIIGHHFYDDITPALFDKMILEAKKKM